MNIKLPRIKSDQLGTNGILSINGKVECYTLEDAWHVAKIQGQTRIPAGTYEIKLRNEGGLTQKYQERFSDIHKGMLHLQDVPNYKYVYLHVGNTEKHTEGCILVGLGSSMIEDKKNVSYSVDAYRHIYPLIADSIISGESVHIEITDEITI